jgi:hypothetical protein
MPIDQHRLPCSGQRARRTRVDLRWLTPDNGRKLVPTGNMYVWDYKGISVTYILLDPQREVAVLRVDSFPI